MHQYRFEHRALKSAMKIWQYCRFSILYHVEAELDPAHAPSVANLLQAINRSFLSRSLRQVGVLQADPRTNGIPRTQKLLDEFAGFLDVLNVETGELSNRLHQTGNHQPDQVSLVHAQVRAIVAKTAIKMLESLVQYEDGLDKRHIN